MFSPEQDNDQVTTSLIEQKVESLKKFLDHFGVELWTKPGTVGFYFPIAKQTPQMASKKTKIKLSTIRETSCERHTSTMKSATFFQESQI